MTCRMPLILRGLGLSVALVVFSGHASIRLPFKRPPTCASVIEISHDTSPNSIRENLRDLAGLVDLLQAAGINTSQQGWVQVLESYIKPTVRPEQPFLLVSILGRTNTGKSTLFNGLEAIANNSSDLNLKSPSAITGIEPGKTKRVTLLASKDLDFDSIVQRFGTVTPWESIADSGKPGSPLLVTSAYLPRNIVFADTPGIEGLSNSVMLEDQSANSAFSTLKTSEVLLYIFSKHETGDLNHMSLLQEAIETWGQRKFVLIFNVDETIDREKAIEQIVLVGKRFDRNFQVSDLGTLESPVLGAYILPESTNVFQGLEQPRLIPIAGTVEFPEFVEILNRHVDQVWENVFKDNLTKVIHSARMDLSEVLRKRLEVSLLRETLHIMSYLAATHVIEDFPYKDMRDELHAYWRELGSNVSLALRNMSDWTARPEKKIIFGNKKPFQLTPKRTGHRALIEGLEGARSEREVRILWALNQLTRQLTEGRVMVEGKYSKDPLVSDNISRAKALAAQLNILKGETNATSTGDFNEINIKSIFDLPDFLSQELNKVPRVSMEQHLQEIQNLLAQFSPPLTERVSVDLIYHLEQARKRQSIFRRGAENAMAHLHWIFPSSEILGQFLADFSLAEISFNPFTYILPANIMARLAYGIDRKFIDTTLAPAVQKWSIERQKYVFLNYLKTHVLRDVYHALDRADQQYSLEGINKDYMKILDDLALAIKEEN